MLDLADGALSLRRQCVRASRRGALGRLPVAQTGQRQRRGADAPDRRTVHRLAVSRLAPDDSDVGDKARDKTTGLGYPEPDKIIATRTWAPSFSINPL